MLATLSRSTDTDWLRAGLRVCPRLLCAQTYDPPPPSQPHERLSEPALPEGRRILLQVRDAFGPWPGGPGPGRTPGS